MGKESDSHKHIRGNKSPHGETLSMQVAQEQAARAKRNAKLPDHPAKELSRKKYSKTGPVAARFKMSKSKVK
jgi:hypothetical protein